MKIKSFIFVCILLFSLVTALGVQSSTEYSFNLLEFPTFNNGTAFVNASQFWNTISLGPLDDANSTQFLSINEQLNIDESFLESFGDGKWLNLNGGNANQNIDIGVFDFSATNFQVGQNITIGDSICLDSECEHFITLNRDETPFGGMANHSTWLGETRIDARGDISYLISSVNRTNLWLQTGRNNSFGGFGNSFGVVPNYMATENFTEGGIINMTKASDYIFLCSFFNVTCLFTADTRGNAIDLLPGGPLVWTMGDLEVWQTLNVIRGGTVHENFDVILTDSNDADIIGGGFHVRESRIEVIGFPINSQVTRLLADFEDDVLFPMVLITSGKGGDEWEAQSVPSCPPNSDFCSHAGPAGGIGNTIMQVNFSTLDLDNLNFSFRLNTLDMLSGGDLEVTIDNNVGNSATLFSLVGSDVFDSLISTSVSSVYNDKATITIEFIFSSSHPNRGDVWVDVINMTGNATTSTEANVTKFDSEFRLGDGALRGDGSGRSIHDIFWNDSSLTLDLPGNTTFIDVTETTLNVTSNASIGDTLHVDFIQPLNTGIISLRSDVAIPSDSFKLFFGLANDASITYNGANLVINPREVGLGSVFVNGDLTTVNLHATTSISTAVINDLADITVLDVDNRILMDEFGSTILDFFDAGFAKFQTSDVMTTSGDISTGTGDIISGGNITASGNVTANEGFFTHFNITNNLTVENITATNIDVNNNITTSNLMSINVDTQFLFNSLGDLTIPNESILIERTDNTNADIRFLTNRLSGREFKFTNNGNDLLMASPGGGGRISYTSGADFIFTLSYSAPHNAVKLQVDEFVVNFIGGSDFDFRSATNNNDNAFNVDASEDRIGVFSDVSVSSSIADFEVNGTSEFQNNVTINANLSIGDRFFLGNGASIGFNATCQMIFYNSTGGVMSKLGCN